ncbi:MAG: helix-turn-helix domain-containing protein [Limnohabitans sp.]
MNILFFDRLQVLIALKKISQKQLSELIGVNERTVSRWRNKEPDIKNIVAISEATGCDLNWLRTGEGTPFQTNDYPASGLVRINSGMKPKILADNEMREPETKMVRMYRELAEMDADTLGEIQTWLNDMESMRPGFTGWFRLEFQNRFPEFDEWKGRITKKRANG